MTLKTGVMAAENSALSSGINYIKKYYILIFHNITIFTVFLIDVFVSMRNFFIYRSTTFEW